MNISRSLPYLAALVITMQALTTTALAYTFDNDVPANIQAQTKDDLNFIGTIESQTTSQLHKQIFGEVKGNDYSHFFNSHINAIGMNSCGSSNAVACVIPFMAPKKMWLTQNYIRFSHPQVARLMILFHESRHTEDENDNWMHADCPVPFLDESGNEIKSIWTGATLAGQAACDETPLGSYGSSMIMLKNISKFCTNCTDKVKMDAGIYADDQFKRVINDGAKKAIRDDLYKSSEAVWLGSR